MTITQKFKQILYLFNVNFVQSSLIYHKLLYTEINNNIWKK